MRSRLKERTVGRWILLETTRTIFKWLNRSDRTKVRLVVYLQVCLSLLDLIGVALIGLIASLSVASLQSETDSQSRVQEIFAFIGMSTFSQESQIFFLGLLAAITLCGRSITSLLITKRVMSFFSNRSAELSIKLIEQLISSSILKVRKNTVQDSVYAITRGSEYLMIQVLGNVTVLVSDFAVLFILGLLLMFVDPVLAILMLIVFGTVTFGLNKLLFKRSIKLGERNTSLNIQSNEAIAELIYSHRELVVGARFYIYVEKVRNIRRKLGIVAGSVNFMPFIGKYVIEATVVIGALLITYFKFLVSSPIEAIQSLVLFLTAGTRIGPAVLRIQNGLVHIRNSLGMAKPTIDMMNEVMGVKNRQIYLAKEYVAEFQATHDGFFPEIRIRELGFRFPGQSAAILENLSIEIPPGSFVALVGESGVGKSTLIDLLLGILQPTTGDISVSGLDPSSAIRKWPGAIGFVPQEIRVFKGTIAENILMGYQPDSISQDELMCLLDMVDLAEFVSELEFGLETAIDEGGFNLSGGQRQRLGIARALLTRPRMLILDEATSALDSNSENSISRTLQDINYEMTRVVVTHRLNTIKNANIVIYLKEGNNYEFGSFEELSTTSKEFEQFTHAVIPKESKA